jgi:hypothetical protein
MDISPYFDETDCKTLGAFCVLVTIGFFIVKQFWHTTKQQAWFIMLLSSFVLTVAGFCYAGSAELDPSLWTEEYMFGDDRKSRTILLFFTACNVMDLTLGYFYYRDFLYPLTTIAHHIFFIFSVLIFLGVHHTRGYPVTFVFELPTLILSIGTVWPSMRSDMAFGVTFMFTRILYHILTIYRFAVMHPHGLAWKVLCMPFMLHAFWIKNWIQGMIRRKDKKDKKAQD